MKRTAHVAVLVLLALGILVSPVRSADFGAVFPAQGAKMVNPPNLTWAAGEYDFFMLMVLAPIPGYWYQPIAIPQVKSYFLVPDSWWEAMSTNGWGLWFVLGMNTTTWDYGITPWQTFQKVTDCVVSFPDPELEVVIRDAISKSAGAILASDLAGLTVLSAANRSISNLRGLEYCENLTRLALDQNPIGELNSLAGLTNLTELSLYMTQIDDLAAMAGLTSLEEILLDVNLISDVGPLSWLTGLAGLYLAGNQISDITPLASLIGLRALGLSGNQISEVSALAALTNLWVVDLSNNQLSDITPVVGLPDLHELYLNYNQIEDLSPLASAGSRVLFRLLLAGNRISDIYPLVVYTGSGILGEVDLQGNDLSPPSCTVHIPELQNRGVAVQHDCR